MNPKIKFGQQLFFCLLLVFLAGCATAETPQPEPSVTTEPTKIPTATNVPTDAPVPITLAWAQKADMPTPRYGHAASVVDGKIYVIGGGEALTKVEMYDPATDSWMSKADMPTGRLWLSTSAVDGELYAIGGFASPDGPLLGTVEVYDPATDTWSTKTEMPEPRGVLATVVLNGKIYAIGGYALTNQEKLIPSGSVEIYDPASDTWMPGTNMRITKAHPSAVIMDGKIFVINGGTPETYNPDRDRWSSMTNFPDKITEKTSIELNSTMITMGGVAGTTRSPVASVFMYDPVSNIWEQLPDMPFSAWMMSANNVDGKIYLIGGVAQQYREAFLDPQPLSSVWEVFIER